MSLERVKLGNVRVVSRIGRGGMGDVYLGVDERLQRKVALKSIRADRRLDAAAQARFVREARILSQLDHPHICRVHDYISAPEADVLVLEFIEGRPLTTLLETPMAWAQRHRIAEQIARALVAAHERGVIHRDLKPGNVMVTPSGDVKVVDFGLAMAPINRLPEEAEPGQPRPEGARPTPGASGSDDASTVADTVAGASLDPIGRSPGPLADPDVTRPEESPSATATVTDTGGDSVQDTSSGFRTQAGLVLGTPLFMSPEQARGEPVTPASDMFALGLLFQQLFTGVCPHPAGLEAREIIERVARGETLPPGPAPRLLLALIGRLKAASPGARPTALDVLERLRWIHELPRRRLFRGILVTVLAGLVAAGVKYTLDVRAARDQANRHRAQAEDLIGFMLGDLREKLEPLGKLSLLGGTGDKALAYFASLPPGEVTDEDRFRQAQALMQVGQVRFAEGRSDDAGQLFTQALDLLRGLTGREPDRLPWQAALGAAQFWVGYLDWMAGRLDEALVQFQAYLEVASRLVVRNPEEARWKMELAQARNNIGAVWEAKGDYAAAIAEFRQAVATKQLLVDREPSEPKWRVELADSQSWLGDALRRSGDLHAAVEQFRNNMANLERLHELDPENREWQRLQAIGHHKTGEASRWMGDLDGAVREQETARDLFLGLTAHDPTNLDWRRDLAVVMAGLGRAHLGRPAGDRAATVLEQARALLLALVEADPRNADSRRHLANVETLLCRANEVSGRLVGALRLADQAQTTLGPIRENLDRPTQQRVAEAALARARVLARLERNAEAAGEVRRALDATTTMGTQTKDLDVLALRAEVWLRAGRAAEAAPLLSHLDRQGFLPPELVEIREPQIQR